MAKSRHWQRHYKCDNKQSHQTMSTVHNLQKLYHIDIFNVICIITVSFYCLYTIYYLYVFIFMWWFSILLFIELNLNHCQRNGTHCFILLYGASHPPNQISQTLSLFVLVEKQRQTCDESESGLTHSRQSLSLFIFHILKHLECVFNNSNGNALCIYIYILHHIIYRFCYCTPEPLLLINQKYDHRWFHAPLLLSWEFWVRIWYFGDNYSISWVQFLLLVISSILVRHWFIYTYMRKVNSTGSFANDWEFFWFSETLRDRKKLLWIREVRV